MTDGETKIRAIVFDLDDTLYDERDYVRSGYRAVAEHLADSAGAGAAGTRGDPAATCATWLWKRFLSGETAGAFDALNSHFSLGLAAPRIMELVEVYRRHAPRIRPGDGIPEMLGRLHAEFRLALLSDGYLPAQRLKLAALKLRRFFDVVVFTEEFGRSAWKPSLKGFEMVQNQLQLTHESLAYVGDNPAKDFVAPNQLGWLTIQFLRPGQIHSHLPAMPAGAPRAIVRSPGGLHQAIVEYERAAK